MRKTLSRSSMSNARFTASEDQRWLEIQRRDTTAAGGYVYAVKTTGIFCRPGCASRLPRRENVTFFETASAAAAAGFRACKRCRPNADTSATGKATAQARAVEAACQLMEASEEPLPLAAIAEAVDYSPAHFHRLFKQTLGVTPKAYAAEVRARRVRAKLLDNGSVTQAVFEAGFATSSRFYAVSDEILGMKPTQYQARGAGQAIHVAVALTTLGWMLVAATDKGLCAVDFGDDKDELWQAAESRFSQTQLIACDEFQGWFAQLIKCVDECRDASSLPLDIRGTAFQHRVWQALRAIPLGETTTYTEIARQIDRPTAARAVARACAANTLAVVVPCHRVIRANGSLAGYRWGIERKCELLQREAQP